MMQKIYRLIGHALGNKQFPLVIIARIDPDSPKMVKTCVSWTTEEHFEKAVDMNGQSKTNAGPNRIVQHFSEKGLALFDMDQIVDAHKRAVTMLWPSNGPSFSQNGDANKVRIEVWEAGKWKVVALNKLLAPTISPALKTTVRVTNPDNMKLARAAHHGNKNGEK